MDILQAVLDKAAASDETRFGAIGLLTNLERLVRISGTRRSSLAAACATVASKMHDTHCLTPKRPFRTLSHVCAPALSSGAIPSGASELLRQLGDDGASARQIYQAELELVVSESASRIDDGSREYRVCRC